MFTVAIVSLLAAVSPGPDFFIVLKNSLVYSRRNGLYTALGVCIALIAHLSYTIVGIGVVLAESPFIYSLIKYAGAGYLLFIGTKSVLSSSQEATLKLTKAPEEISASKSFMQGFLTNLLNPKCALFFISLFSQFISPESSSLQKLAYAAINWSVCAIWFTLLVYLVTTRALHEKLQRFRLLIDRIMGAALLFLGAKLLFV